MAALQGPVAGRGSGTAVSTVARKIGRHASAGPLMNSCWNGTWHTPSGVDGGGCFAGRTSRGRRRGRK
jgi:hypothetical protein